MADPFVALDWQLPLDPEEYLRAIPTDSMAKGVFFRSAVSLARDKTGQAPGRDKYSALTDYPTRELAEVLVECSRLVFPQIPLRQALRQLGHGVFPGLRSTSAGTFLFSVAGNRAMSAVGLVGRAYQLFARTASAKATVLDDNNAIVELRNVWTFPEAYHVGTFEGAGQVFGENCEVLLRRHSMCDIDLKLSFSQRVEP